MTAFPTTSVSEGSRLLTPESSRFVIDSVSERSRRTTPQEVLDQRQVQRMSISEINESDFDELRRRVETSRADTRPPVVKALDVIDAPRNLLFNMMFGGIARQQEIKGERGAFGAPRVMFSDVLKGLGVENNVAAGLLGFVGDVALDPLTYLGGTGAGLRVGSTAISRTGTAALKKGIKETAKTGSTKGEIGKLLADPRVGFTPERVERVRRGFQQRGVKDVDKATASFIRNSVLGGKTSLAPRRVIKGTDLDNKALRDEAGNILRSDIAAPTVAGSATRSGNVIRQRQGRLDRIVNRGARTADEGDVFATQQAQALQRANEFFARYQRGSTALPGINIAGRGAATGSEILSVPFTDLAVRVPAFTKGAKQANARGVRASAGGTTSVAKSLQEQVLAGTPESYEELIKVSEEIQDLSRKIDAEVTRNPAGDTVYEPEIRNLMAKVVDDPERAADLLPDDISAEEAIGVISQELDDLIRVTKKGVQEDVLNAAARFDAPEVRSVAAASSAISNAQSAQASYRRMEMALARMRAAKEIKHPSLGDRSLIDTLRDIKKSKENIQNETASLSDLMARGQLDDGMVERIDQLRKEFGDKDRELFDRLLNMNDIEARSIEREIDLLHESVQVQFEAAQLAQGSVQRVLSSDELAAVEMAKQFLGTDDARQGLYAMAGVSSTLRALGAGDDGYIQRLNRRAASATDRVFGNKGSREHDVMRRGLTTVDRAAMAEYNRVERELITRTRELVMNKHKLASEDVDLAETLISAYQMELMNIKHGGSRGFSTYDVVAYAKDPTGMVVDSAGRITRDGVPVYSKWMQNIQDAKANRYFSKKPASEGLLDSLKQEAQRRVDEFERLGAEAQNLGLVDLLGDVYIPNLPSEELAAVIRSNAQSNPRFRSVKSSARGSGTEGFQIRRTTDHYWFQGKDGEWRFFLESDRLLLDKLRQAIKLREGRNLADIPQSELSEAFKGLDVADQVASSGLEALKVREEAVKAFDELDLEQQLFASRPTDPFMMNELAGQGRFAPLTNTRNYKRSAWETANSRLLAARTAAQTRAAANSAVRHAQAQHGIFIRGDDLLTKFQANTGTEVLLPSGVKAKIISSIEPGTGNSIGYPAIEVGGQRYRVLNDNKLRGGTSNPMFNALSDASKDADMVALYPEHIATAIERFEEAIADDQIISWAIDAASKVNGIWKTTTLLHPSWVIGNVLGNLILGATMMARVGLGQEGLTSTTKRLRDGHRIAVAKRRGESLDSIKVVVDGQEITGRELMDLFDFAGISGANRTSEVIRGLSATGNFRFRDTGPVKGFTSEFFERLSDMKAGEDVSKAKNAAAAVSAGTRTVGSRSMNFLGGWFRMNEQIEDSMRMAMFLGMRDAGIPEDQAIRAIAENLFDYGDLTRTESQVLRNVFPFYVWMRNSAAHQVHLALQRPAYLGVAPKVKEMLEEIMVAEAQIPEHQRPNWLRENLSVQLGADPETRFMFTAGTLLPQEQALRLSAAATGVEGVQDLLNFFLSSVTPAARVPAEIASGREFFTDRSIGATSTRGDISVAEAIGNQIRPVRELGLNPFSVRPGAIPAAFDRSITEGFGRLTVGGRIQGASDDRLRSNMVRELKERDEGIRRAIRIAEREGNALASRAARVELMLLYKDALERGLEDAVPKWAQTQLREIGGPVRFDDAPASGSGE